MTLHYAGLDEAGYGPMLGPLCVAMSSFTVDNWTPGEKAPDLWALLSKAVGKTKRDAKSKVAVGDSKTLKLSNTSKTQHPLVHLERAVLTFLATRDGDFPRTDIQLFESLGAQLENQPWYSGAPIELPLGLTTDQLAIDISHLRSEMSKVNINLHELTVRVVDVTEFNRTFLEHRSKAAATQLALVELLSRVQSQRVKNQFTRVICDRQSGRTRYHSILSSVFHELEIQEETPRASRYGFKEELGVTLTPKADNAYFPVALASMAAKLVREISMIRFNRYWGTKELELKPTVGYVQDARRWLNDTDSIISDDERKAMIRLA
ncbi:MAG: hypothetical protein P1U42_10200 [Phycisphaerales bacterium]|nr:hypothetical protein [Phycisphaerales bacterium]